MRWLVGGALLGLRWASGRWLLDLDRCGFVLCLGFGRWRGGVCWRGRWLRLGGCGLARGRGWIGGGGAGFWLGFRRFWRFGGGGFRNLGGVLGGIAF